MNPLKTFDFTALDDASYKEDSVREDIIRPILGALGYGPTGRFQMMRSKALRHPFVMLGSRKRTVRIVPDYTLLIDDKPVLVLDAKAASEDVTKREHVWQAYSYAAHPEVRCDRYGVCNGKRLVVFAMSSWNYEADVDLTRLDESWDDLMEAIGTDALMPRIEDVHTTWFSLLALLLSPNTPPDMSANAAYRLSWYMPAVDASRKAAAQAAMANLSDVELITVLKAGAYLYNQLDGSPAEHVGDMLSYDPAIVGRLTVLLDAHKIPDDLTEIAREMILYRTDVI